MIDEVSYEAFKVKCYKMTESLSENIIVELIIANALKYYFSFGDPTSIESKIETRKFFIEYLKEKLEGKDENANIELYEKMIRDNEKYIENVEKDTEVYYKKYNEFCEKIVKKLYDEEFSLHKL